MTDQGTNTKHEYISTYIGLYESLAHGLNIHMSEFIKPAFVALAWLYQMQIYCQAWAMRPVRPGPEIIDAY
jgi:hypothetical protein